MAPLNLHQRRWLDVSHPLDLPSWPIKGTQLISSFLASIIAWFFISPCFVSPYPEQGLTAIVVRRYPTVSTPPPPVRATGLDPQSELSLLPLPWWASGHRNAIYPVLQWALDTLRSVVHRLMDSVYQFLPLENNSFLWKSWESCTEAPGFSINSSLTPDYEIYLESNP
jgi:hypothetical protein